MKSFADIAFTPPVKALQTRAGSRAAYARNESADGAADDDEEGLGRHEAAHLANADSFYLATVNRAGWPYIQHRGGPRGFLRVLSPSRLAFADFGGNRQFISVGNTTENDRVSLIVVDYPNRRRLKLLGRLRFEPVESAEPDLVRAVDVAGYKARVERIAVIEVEAFDWNCPQHITPRFTLEEIEAASKPLHDRIARLEAEVEALRRGGG